MLTKKFPGYQPLQVDIHSLLNAFDCDCKDDKLPDCQMSTLKDAATMVFTRYVPIRGSLSAGRL